MVSGKLVLVVLRKIVVVIIPRKHLDNSAVNIIFSRLPAAQDKYQHFYRHNSQRRYIHSIGENITLKFLYQVRHCEYHEPDEQVYYAAHRSRPLLGAVKLSGIYLQEISLYVKCQSQSPDYAYRRVKIFFLSLVKQEKQNCSDRNGQRSNAPQHIFQRNGNIIHIAQIYLQWGEKQNIKRKKQRRRKSDSLFGVF